MIALAVLFLLAAAVVVGEPATRPWRERRATLRRAAAYGGPTRRRDRSADRQRLAAGAVVRLERLARVAPGTSNEKLIARLQAAGLADRVGVREFLALKAALTLVGLALGVAAAAAGGGKSALLLGFLAGGAGYVGPDVVARVRASRRREQMGKSLPRTLDLLAVSVEAGLGLDAAVQKVATKAEGPLADELAEMLGELRMGVSRRDALRNLARRVDIADFTTSVRAILHADQLGIPLARILRVQSREIRKRRQADAEERANKAPIKMLFPTALFIFPALFIIVIGPAAITIARYL
jgi:tight adherence protein C